MQLVTNGWTSFATASVCLIGIGSLEIYHKTHAAIALYRIIIGTAFGQHEELMFAMDQQEDWGFIMIIDYLYIKYNL